MSLSWCFAKGNWGEFHSESCNMICQPFLSVLCFSREEKQRILSSLRLSFHLGIICPRDHRPRFCSSGKPTQPLKPLITYSTGQKLYFLILWWTGFVLTHTHTNTCENKELPVTFKWAQLVCVPNLESSFLLANHVISGSYESHESAHAGKSWQKAQEH